MDRERMDCELVLRIRKGDAGGLDVALKKYWTPLVQFVTTLGVDGDAAEDVVQQTFVRLWERREQLRLAGSLRGFLYRVARNLCFDKLRRSKARERAAERAKSVSAIPSPYEQVAEGELTAIIEKAIDALPERGREVFRLVRYQGLSHREVAETLDLAPQTVANHLGMALADLRVLLAPYLPDYYCPSATADQRLQTPRAIGAYGA